MMFPIQEKNVKDIYLVNVLCMGPQKWNVQEGHQVRSSQLTIYVVHGLRKRKHDAPCMVHMLRYTIFCLEHYWFSWSS